MRKPDYDRMRESLACFEAETMQTSDVYEILLHGVEGYKNASNDEVLKLFCDIWQTSEIPKIKVEE